MSVLLRPQPRAGVLKIDAYVPGKSAAPGAERVFKLSSNETPLGPSPKAIAFADWESAPSVRLLTDPLKVESGREPEPVPDAWREFLVRPRPQDTDAWTFHDAETAYRTTFDEGEFLVLAERQGDEFVLHRIEPLASTLFYMASHDGTPEPIEGNILDVFRKTNNRSD